MTAATGSAPLTDTETAWLKEVGMRIRLARVRRGESQDQLGARAGVSRVTVGSVERADHVAALLAYSRLATALCLPLEVLLAPLPLPKPPLVTDGEEPR